MYNSVALSTSILLCNHQHYPSPELFHLPQLKLSLLSINFPLPTTLVVPFKIRSILYSVMFIHSFPLQTHCLLHAALCHIKLTSVDDTFGFPCLLASSWIQPVRGTDRSRGQEERKDRAVCSSAIPSELWFGSGCIPLPNAIAAAGWPPSYSSTFLRVPVIVSSPGLQLPTVASPCASPFLVVALTLLILL